MRKIILFLIMIISLSSLIVFAEAGSTGSTELKPKLDTTAGKYGYVDSVGNWVIAPQFQEASEFSEGLASVRCFEEKGSEMAYGAYINTKGEIAFDKKFFWGFSFKDGYAVVTDNDEKVSIIDKNGNTVLKTDYYYFGDNSEIPGIRILISNVHPGRSLTSPIVGYITNDLKLIKPMFSGNPSYYRLDDSEEYFASANYVEYDGEGKLLKQVSYVINSELEPVAMPEGFVSSIKDGMILINSGSTYAFIDMEGRIIDEIFSSKTGKKHKFSKAWSFNDGHALVAVEGVLEDPYGDPITAYGYINKDGTAFMEPKYSSANSFSGGLAAVQLHPSYSFGMAILKANGEYLLTPKVRPQIPYTDNEKDFFTNGLYSQGEYYFVKAEVARIVSEITTNNMSDLEKLAAIHKYVLDHANYSLVQVKDPNPLGLRYMYEAIGILKDKKVVCNGYSKLLGLLLNEAGIENLHIVGEAVSGKDYYVPHSWNLVKIGDKYYHLDVTWNDKEGPDKYYLVSDDYMKQSRRWEYSEYPEVSKGYSNDKWQPKK